MIVYLIERIQAMQINGKATYWSGDEELPPGGETNDPWDACWFPRKQDAARIAVGRFGKNLARSGWQIVEHVFSPPRAEARPSTETRPYFDVFMETIGRAIHDGLVAADASMTPAEREKVRKFDEILRLVDGGMEATEAAQQVLSSPPRAEALAPHQQTVDTKEDTRGGSQ